MMVSPNIVAFRHMPATQNVVVYALVRSMVHFQTQNKIHKITPRGAPINFSKTGVDPLEIKRREGKPPPPTSERGLVRGGARG